MVRMTNRKSVAESVLKMTIPGEHGILFTDETHCKHLEAGKYTICGLWFKNPKRCKSGATCVFKSNEFYKLGYVGSTQKGCNFSDAKIRGNLLTTKRLEKLLPKKRKKSVYNTEW